MAQGLNKLDRGILDVLIRAAKTPYAIIASKFKVSNGTIHVRIKKLERMGVITGATMNVDYKKLGYDIHAYVGIKLDNGTSFKSVIGKLEKVTEITAAHFTTGQYGIFAQVRCKNTEHLKEVLNDKVQKIKGIQSTESFIALEEGIERGGLAT